MADPQHLSIDERRERGRQARTAAPRTAQADLSADPDRPDPIALLEAQNLTREPDLVPVRHGRMAASPFTFYRGAAKIMASDLSGTLDAGLNVQLCGDAHLSNFGVFASPERTLLFDLNDFDETLPGPFEWDVKRMAASFAIAARNNGFGEDEASDIAKGSAWAYHDTMRTFARQRTLDVWYAKMNEKDILKATRKAVGAPTAQLVAEKIFDKARTRDSTQALSKLGEVVDGQLRIVSQPPVVIPSRDLAAAFNLNPDEVEAVVQDRLNAYRKTLQHDRRQLLERYEFVDVARKVVGVGSVGTRAFIVLLVGRDSRDPLFLQVKEATRSVLEDHLPKSRFRQPGERVVHGQRMMQAASDIFLGWTKGVDEDRYYYWRQLRDAKGSIDVEGMRPQGLILYAALCGWTLARAHARSGDAVAIASYLGSSTRFSEAIAAFSLAYADQNEQDYRAFTQAIASGRLAAVEGV